MPDGRVESQFVVNLSNHSGRPFDKLRANGGIIHHSR